MIRLVDTNGDEREALIRSSPFQASILCLRRRHFHLGLTRRLNNPRCVVWANPL